jgi:hypothetical protein
MDCFLMPHPGLKVANGTSRGAIRDLEDDFVEEMKVRMNTFAFSWRAVKHFEFNIKKSYHV